jgi:MerR family transcriptional regulator, copper efflux regulator
MDTIYLIKDLSRETGFSTHAIKYYYKLGLIREIGRSPHTNFRYFDESSVERLRQVHRLRRERFSLKEVKRILLLPEENK